MLLQADYVKSPEGVLRDATGYVLRQRGGLTVLKSVKHRLDTMFVTGFSSRIVKAEIVCSTQDCPC
jgi:hypothetical protein